METLTVSNSEDGAYVKIEGTQDSLQLVEYLINQLLEHPEDGTITAHHPTSNVSVVVKLVE